MRTQRHLCVFCSVFSCKQPQDDVEYRIPLRVQDTALVSCYSDEMKSEQVKIKDLSNADSLNMGSYSFETTLENMGKANHSSNHLASIQKLQGAHNQVLRFGLHLAVCGPVLVHKIQMNQTKQQQSTTSAALCHDPRWLLHKVSSTWTPAVPRQWFYLKLIKKLVFFTTALLSGQKGPWGCGKQLYLDWPLSSSRCALIFRGRPRIFLLRRNVV